MDEKPEIDSEDLDGLLGRALRRIERQKRLYLEREFAGTGLHGTLYRFLLVLGRNPGASQDLFAERLVIDKGNIARSARKLEDLGYIERKPDENNRRQYRIYLTERGQEVLESVVFILKRWNTVLAQGFTQQEERDLISYLGKMYENTLCLR